MCNTRMLRSDFWLNTHKAGELLLGSYSRLGLVIVKQ